MKLLQRMPKMPLEDALMLIALITMKVHAQCTAKCTPFPGCASADNSAMLDIVPVCS